MFIQFLIEDQSGEVLIDIIMEKYNAESAEENVEYDTKWYKGIGGFPKGSNAKNIKSEQLLMDLPKRLRAISNSWRGKYGKEDAAIFVILDNDIRDTADFQNQLQALSDKNNITIDHVYCIAVEEMEAWLLGDREAIQAAYPSLSDRIASKHPNYRQDSICGTWEFLADMLTKRGIGVFRKNNPSPHDIGQCKREWAEKIGARLTIRGNASPSFQVFLSELDKRTQICA
ncbi:MAG: DUF4276 family protein [Oscillospiraceae bacterium]|nr:DUF4276 family protein [Oscillospiraceae bacterium]